MSMITTSTWVRRGVAAQFPTKYEIDEGEMSRISKLAKMQLEDAQGDLSTAQTEGKQKGDGDEKMDEDDGVEGSNGRKDKG